MFPLPEWAPSVHPLIIHFPIALLFIAVLADFLSLVSYKHVWLRWVALGLYTLGVLSALVGFFTGQDAAESVFLSATANSLLTDHANWAEWTVWFYGVYAVARWLVEWRWGGQLRAVSILLFFIGAAGLFLVKETGERGAQMVYQHGVGVRSFAIDTRPRDIEGGGSELSHGGSGERTQMDAQTKTGEHLQKQDGRGSVRAEKEEHGHTSHDHEQMFQEPVVEIKMVQNGWKWRVEKNGVTEFKKQFQMILGDLNDVQISVGQDNSRKDVIALQTNDVPMMFTAGSPIANLQYDLRLNMSGFVGAVRLVHHLQDVENYNFLEIRETGVVLGRVAKGILFIEGREDVAADGWLDVRVVSDGTHFRGYVNKKMVVHGHGEEPATGVVGFYVRGTGVVMFDQFDVQVLR